MQQMKKEEPLVNTSFLSQLTTKTEFNKGIETPSKKTPLSNKVINTN